MMAVMKRRVPYVLGALALFALFFSHARWSAMTLGEPAVWTGYYLATLVLFLGAFNLRKRLSVLALGPAAVWLRLHVAGGVLALPLFWLHTGTIWPTGVFEGVLAAVFYLVGVTGLAGFILQRLYPARLTQSGVEVIYERIPAEIAALREEAEALIVDCTEKTGSDTIARQYLETFAWYFRKPRFFASHAFGGQRGGHWVRTRTASLRRYLNQEEEPYLDRLCDLAFAKNRVDLHYAAQAVMKGWLLVHLPLSAALLVLGLWHAGLVHIYAL